MGTTEEIKIKKVHTFLDLAIASIVLAAGIGTIAGGARERVVVSGRYYLFAVH